MILDIYDKNERAISVGDKVKYTDRFNFECTGIVKFGAHVIYGREEDIDALNCYGAYVERITAKEGEWGVTTCDDEPYEFEAVVSVLLYDLEVIN